MKLTVGDLALYYETAGAGIPLLCIHAFPCDGRLWTHQRELAGQAQLIIPDLRGQGRSSVTPGPYRMELLAEDMVALLAHLGIDRAVVMGDSVGGYVALAMYALYPERFRAIILTDTRAEADGPPARERRARMVEQFHREGIAPALEMLPGLVGSTTRQEHPEVIELLRAQVAEATPEGLAEMQRGMTERPDRTALLEQMRVPALVLCGEEDTNTTPDVMRALAARIPGATFRLIPRAGHLPPLEHPGAFNAAVAEFLARLPE